MFGFDLQLLYILVSDLWSFSGAPALVGCREIKHTHTRHTDFNHQTETWRTCNAGDLKRMGADRVETELCDRLLKLVSELLPAMKVTQTLTCQKSEFFVIWRETGLQSVSNLSVRHTLARGDYQCQYLSPVALCWNITWPTVSLSQLICVLNTVQHSECFCSSSKTIVQCTSAKWTDLLFHPVQLRLFLNLVPVRQREPVAATENPLFPIRRSL